MSDHGAIEFQAQKAPIAAKPNGSGQVIPDPGNASASKYAASPAFAAGGAIRQFTAIIPDHPKTYCRAFPDMAVLIWAVNLSRAKDAGKKLFVITPEAVAEGALDGLIEPFQALATPMIDRDGSPFLWCVRQFNRDGQQLDSFDGAMAAIAAAAEEWQKIWWGSGGWTYDQAPNPSVMHITIPANLKTIDDWIEGAFPGRLIRRAKAEELERLRGNL